MKKKLTYPLIVLVALIWGLVIYRVVHGGADEGEEEGLVPNPPRHATTKHLMVTAPVLSLDYRDPFLEEEVPEQKPEAPPTTPIAAPVVVETDWSVIKYMGAILNPNTNKLVFLLNIGGQDHLMTTGKSNTGVEVLKGNTDSVLVRYQGKQKLITKE